MFLYNFINQLGGDPFFLPTAQDNLKSLELILHQSQGYDLVVSTGGASVGDYDLVQTALKNQNFKLLFWKIAMRPGKPVFFGALKNIPFLGLPGNPVSVHLLYGMLIKPLIEYICSGKLNLPKSTKVKVNFSMKKKNKRLEWLRVMVQKNKDELIVNKFPKQGSGMISSIAYSDGIIEIPEKVSFISKGEYYSFYSYDCLLYTSPSPRD